MSEQGALTEAAYYILLSLLEPRHGYGIMQYVAEISGGRVHLAAGTLYGALTNLCDRGWIEERPGARGSRNKREYRITDAGREAVRRELGRLEELAGNGRRILGEAQE